jgi:hypothetical protein
MPSQFVQTISPISKKKKELPLTEHQATNLLLSASFPPLGGQILAEQNFL